jgi:hypothetical protein
LVTVKTVKDRLGRKPKVSKALEIDHPVAEKPTTQRVLRNRNR